MGAIAHPSGAVGHTEIESTRPTLSAEATTLPCPPYLGGGSLRSPAPQFDSTCTGAPAGSLGGPYGEGARHLVADGRPRPSVRDWAMLRPIARPRRSPSRTNLHDRSDGCGGYRSGSARRHDRHHCRCSPGRVDRRSAGDGSARARAQERRRRGEAAGDPREPLGQPDRDVYLTAAAGGARGCGSTSQRVARAEPSRSASAPCTARCRPRC